MFRFLVISIGAVLGRDIQLISISKTMLSLTFSFLFHLPLLSFIFYAIITLLTQKFLVYHDHETLQIIFGNVWLRRDSPKQSF